MFKVVTLILVIASCIWFSVWFFNYINFYFERAKNENKTNDSIRVDDSKL